MVEAPTTEGIVSKIVLVLLVLVLGVLVTPSLRERATPHVQFALDPVYEWSARNDLKEMQRFIDRSRVLPQPREFPAFVERERGPGSSQDPWGNPYYVRIDRETYRLGSAGRDGVVGTARDIVTDPKPVPRPF
jgi:hypothetical protein